MNKKYILFFLFGLLSITISAQSLAEAKALYEKGEYEEAKPTFKKLVKTQPGNGNYNLWYGVCCLETGEPAEALKHLESAVKRRVPSGQLYLARAYNDLYRFEEAIETYETYISDLRKRKRSTIIGKKQIQLAHAERRGRGLLHRQLCGRQGKIPGCIQNQPRIGQAVHVRHLLQ